MEFSLKELLEFINALEQSKNEAVEKALKEERERYSKKDDSLTLVSPALVSPALVSPASQKITKEQVAELLRELIGYPEFLEAILKKQKIKSLADMNKDLYYSTLDRIHEKKKLYTANPSIDPNFKNG